MESKFAAKVDFLLENISLSEKLQGKVAYFWCYERALEANILQQYKRSYSMKIGSFSQSKQLSIFVLLG